MKIQKKITAGIIGAMMILGLCAGSALAATCSDATIVGAGVFPDQTVEGRSSYRIRAICNDASPPWTLSRSFYLTTDLGESGYASVLTAYSLDKNVRLDMVSATKDSLVYNIYILE